MSLTVRQLMDEQAAGLVGRDDEMALLRQLFGGGGPLVVFVHGIAGIGKSALLEAFAVEARAQGTTVLRLDCRSIEPTERGFLAALEDRTGGQLSTAEDAAARLGSLGDRVVLMVDTYELFRILDPWLRQAFVPALTIEQLGTRSPLVLGLVFSAYIAPGVLGAPIGGRFPPATGQRIGILVFLVGMAGIVGSLAVGNLGVFIVASVLAGTGQGIAVSAMIRGILHGSQVSDRGPIFGAIYLLSYCGAAIPSLISGQLSRVFTTFELACGYGALAVVATAFVLVFAKNPLPATSSTLTQEVAS